MHDNHHILIQNFTHLKTMSNVLLKIFHKIFNLKLYLKKKNHITFFFFTHNIVLLLLVDDTQTWWTDLGLGSSVWWSDRITTGALEGRGHILSFFIYAYPREAFLLCSGRCFSGKDYWPTQSPPSSTESSPKHPTAR